MIYEAVPCKNISESSNTHSVEMDPASQVESQERLEKMGIKGFIPNFKVTCADHEGGAPVKFQRCNGKAFEPASDWISTDQSLVRPMIEASASKYAKEKGLSAACN